MPTLYGLIPDIDWSFWGTEDRCYPRPGESNRRGHPLTEFSEVCRIRRHDKVDLPRATLPRGIGDRALKRRDGFTFVVERPAGCRAAEMNSDITGGCETGSNHWGDRRQRVLKPAPLPTYCGRPDGHHKSTVPPPWRERAGAVPLGGALGADRGAVRIACGETGARRELGCGVRGARGARGAPTGEKGAAFQGALSS